MKKLSLVLLIYLHVSCSFAACVKPVQYLQEGQSACMTGYLFSPDMELKARTAMENYNKVLEITKQQDVLIENQDKRIALESERYATLKQQMDLNNEKSFWERAAWFAAGALLTGGIFYVSNK
jgi:hypothetical protein